MSETHGKYLFNPAGKFIGGDAKRLTNVHELKEETARKRKKKDLRPDHEKRKGETGLWRPRRHRPCHGPHELITGLTKNRKYQM